VKTIAEQIGATPSQVALSWVANQPSVTSPIFRARNMKRLTDNLAAADLTLDEEATATLNKISAPTPATTRTGHSEHCSAADTSVTAPSRWENFSPTNDKRENPRPLSMKALHHRCRAFMVVTVNWPVADPSG
jgi:hypothetical protein